jgi:GT2 family glycosyltransferase
MAKFAFVVLHYQTIEPTKETVNSILALDSGNPFIVIVDNASPNGTGLELQEFYTEFQRVVCLLNPENLGFAQGCNVGFAYAKQTLGAEYICLLNNDVVLEQKNWTEIVERKFAERQFSILSPTQGTNDPKIRIVRPIDQFIGFSVWMHKMQYALCLFYLTLVAAVLSRIWGKVWERIQTSYGFAFMPPAGQDLECVPLGACMVLSPLFVAEYDGLDPRTTFYGEELILFAKLHAKGERSLFSPELKILHKHGTATKKSFAGVRKRLLFVHKNFAHGYEIYRSVLREIKGEKR